MHMAVGQLVSINRLGVGQSARVNRIDGQPEYVHRLEEYGLRRGIDVRMFRPGNPCIISLSGHKVCLRYDSLLKVLVNTSEGVGS